MAARGGGGRTGGGRVGTGERSIRGGSSPSLERAKRRLDARSLGRGAAAAGRRGVAVARRGRGRVPARSLRAGPRPPRRRRGGLVARAGRFALRRARGDAPRPAAAEARPVRRGRGAARRRPPGLGPARHRGARDAGAPAQARGAVRRAAGRRAGRLGQLPRPVRPAPATGQSRLDRPRADREDLARPGEGRPRTPRTTTGSGSDGRTSPSAPASSPGARRWLDDCLRRRPHDAPVWKGRLDLALATGDAAGAGGPRAPPARPRPARGGPRHYAPGSPRDPATAERERQALETLLEHAPGRFQAVERLAELELLAGRPESAARLVRGRSSSIGPRSITRCS